MNPRILLVASDQAELAAVRQLLTNEWCTWEIEFCDSATAALGAMDAHPVDVIVADLRMPGATGGKLLAEVRRRHADTARLVLSEEADEADFANVVSVAHQFVRKPYVGEDLRIAVGRALQMREQLDGEFLRGDVSAVDVLPSPPAIFKELAALIESPDADARRVAALLERDVALSAKVLQVVNSAFFAPRARVTSLEAAVVRLGLRVIRSLMCVDHMQRGFNAPPSVQSWISGLNSHAYEAARLARLLARPRERDDAFCAALLHECGQLVFARSRPGVFDAHLQLRDERLCPLAEVEAETFGFSHAQAGAYLLGLWGFPSEVVDAVAAHDDGWPDEDAERDLSWAVQTAHLIVEAGGHAMCGIPGGEVDAEWIAALDIEEQLREWAGTRDEQIAV